MIKPPEFLLFILLLACRLLSAQDTINIGDLQGKWSYAWQEMILTNPAQKIHHQYIYTFYPDHTAESRGSRSEKDLYQRMTWNYDAEKNLLTLLTRDGEKEYTSKFSILKLTAKTMLLKSLNQETKGDRLEYQRLADIKLGNLPGKWKQIATKHSASEREGLCNITFFRDHTCEFLCTGYGGEQPGLSTATWHYDPDTNSLEIIFPKTGDMEKEDIVYYTVVALTSDALILQNTVFMNAGDDSPAVQKFKRQNN